MPEKLSRLFPPNCFTIFDLQNWLRVASKEEQEEFLEKLDYSTIMKTSRVHDKNIQSLIDSGAREEALEQIHVPLINSLVKAASNWSFLRDGRERPIKDVVREQLKHDDLI